MAAIDWPATLPYPLVGTIAESHVEAYASDAASIGAPRRRKRFTRTLNGFDFSIRMEDAEAAILRTFINTTSDGGVEEFNWTHPETSVSYEVRFKSLPQIKQVSIGIWDAQISLEEI